MDSFGLNDIAKVWNSISFLAENCLARYKGLHRNKKETRCLIGQGFRFEVHSNFCLPFYLGSVNASC